MPRLIAPNKLFKLSILSAAALFATYSFVSQPVGAFSHGPPPSYTGAPGEGVCTACHTSYALNSGPGKVVIDLPANYTPGQSVPVAVTTVHPDGFLYGFELTALDATGAQAGTITLTDAAHTQLRTGTVGGNSRSYIEHTYDGAFPVEFNQRKWTFTWVAPQTDAGPVTFYAAGNGANGDGESTGDYIYTSQKIVACTTSNPSSQSFTASAGSGTLSLTSACSWAATTLDSWITIPSNTGGTGNGTVTFSVDANLSTSPRSGAITVGGLRVPILQGAQFNDVPQTHQFYTEIGKLSARGVTIGCGGGNYCPDQVVSREQMAAFIIKALGQSNPPAPAQPRFLDVPSSSLYYAFIDRMAVLGITSGCGGGNYCPGDPVSREQMAAFIIRALGEPNPPTPQQPRFKDVPPSNSFYNFIDRMGALGITSGCGGGNYCPSASVTRGQMAAFLVRAFSL